MGFQATLSCRSGVNTLTKGQEDCLWLLKRNIRRPDGSLRDIMEKLELDAKQ